MVSMEKCTCLLIFCCLLGVTKQQSLADILLSIGNRVGTTLSTATMSNCILGNLSIIYEDWHNPILQDLSNLVEKELTVTLYTKTSFYPYNLTLAPNGILINPNFNKSRSIAMVVVGYMMLPFSLNVATIINSLVKRNDVNVLLFDVGPLSFYDYGDLSFMAKLLGIHLGIFLHNLYSGGLKNNAIHLIGHSIGAHISGFAGRTFTNRTGLKIARISGLDVAGPCFFVNGPEYRLSTNDANFVDVIHTNDGFLGINKPIGHVDFYPNGGATQTSAFSIDESHGRSWKYFSESINLPNQGNFLAISCPDWNTFSSGGCAGNSTVYMGYVLSPTTRGKYFLKTAGTSPYGLGEGGTVIVKSIWQLFLDWILWLFGIKA